MTDQVQVRTSSIQRLGAPFVALLLAAILLLGLSACDFSSATPTPIAAPTPPPTADLLAVGMDQLPEATALNIRDDWSGASPVSPVLAHYYLTRSSGALTGLADFSVGEFQGRPITTTDTVTIPAEVVSDFLNRLSEVPLTEGNYVPRQDAVENTNISLTITVPAGTIFFYTQSQGDDHTPWAATLDTTTYVIDTPAVAEAFALLEPYLKRDVLESLVKRASEPQ